MRNIVSVENEIAKAYIHARRYFEVNNMFRSTEEFLEAIATYYSRYTGIKIAVREVDNEIIIVINSNKTIAVIINNSMDALIGFLSTFRKITIAS